MMLLLRNSMAVDSFREHWMLFHQGVYKDAKKSTLLGLYYKLLQKKKPCINYHNFKKWYNEE